MRGQRSDSTTVQPNSRRRRPRLIVLVSGRVTIVSHRSREPAGSGGKGQSLSDPPKDVPWCFYDLAEMRLYQGDEEGFLSYLKEAFKYSKEDWQIETFQSALEDAKKIDLPGLTKGTKKLQQELTRKKKKSK